MEDSRAFLGRGFAFPPEVDPVTGKFRMAEGEEDIRQAIYIILMTRLKERAMLQTLDVIFRNIYMIFQMQHLSPV